MKKKFESVVGKTFFATFETENNMKSFRMEFIREKDLTTEHFLPWIEEKREEIKKQYKSPAIVVNCNII